MKELRFPDFPREEFLARYVRTQQILKRHGLDALFLTQRQNLRYFAGLRDGAWDAYHFYFMILLPVEGDPVLFVANGFNHLVEQCWIEDVRNWPWQKEFYLAKESAAIPLVVQTLKEKCPSAGVIGMELSPDIHVHMGQLHFDALRRDLSQAKIVDGCEAIWEIRSIKSPAEIARLRKAAGISAKGVMAGFEALKPGMTEKQIVAIMTSVMCAEGASEQRFNALYAGPRAMWADGMPTDYVIQWGDLVQFDGGCVYEGYWCDFKRMACIGEPRPDQRLFYNLAKDGLHAAIRAIRPGVSFNAPLQAAFAVNDKAGFGAFSKWCLENGWSAIGHSLGQDIHELPGLSATNTALIKEDMVFSVEPYITLNGVFPFWEATEKFGLEDVVVVTKDDVEILTSEDKITHELWIA
jgi:Xaa-Pro aminopeptidase